MAAVLGAQLAFTMIIASVLSKFSGRYSFGRWILCNHGLARFIHPSDEDLRRASGNSSTKPGSKPKPPKRNDKKDPKEDFTILKSAIDAQLDSTQIRPIDLLPLQFYTEFQWLVDFSVCALFIYAMTEIYYVVFRPPATETNLSLLWCILVGGFALKIMYSMTAIYFHLEDSGEKILCIVFALFFLVVAMGVLIVDERTLDFGLLPAYSNFSAAAAKFLSEAGDEDSGDGPVSLLTIRIILAAVCAVVGSFLTFPGLRLAKMHTDALRYSAERPFRQILLYINIAFPLVVSLLWVRPLFRDRLTGFGNVTTIRVRDLDVDEEAVDGETVVTETVTKEVVGLGINDETAQTIRVLIVFVFCVFRFVLIWDHLQAHLNMAIDRVTDLKKEAGRITSTELKKHIVRVYYYLCVVALQYLAPLVLLTFTAILLKTLGDFSFSRLLGFDLAAPPRSPLEGRSVLRAGAGLDPDSAEGIAENIIGTAAEFSRSLGRLKMVFTPMCYRGLLSFGVWWVSTAWFVTSAFGLVYHSYFRD